MITLSTTRAYLSSLLLLLLTACGDDSWRLEGTTRLTAGPLVDQDKLYVAHSRFGVTRSVAAYEPRTGLELWQAPIQSWEDCLQLAVHEGQGMVACGTELWGFDAVSGQTLWRRSLSGPPASSILLQEQLGALLTRLPSGELELVVVEATSGSPTIVQILPGDASLVRLGGAVIVSTSGLVSAVHPSSGQQLWSYRWDAAGGSMLVSATGLLLISQGTIIGLDPATGTVRWVRPTDGLAAPAVLDSLLCFSQHGTLYAVDANTGLEKWRHRVAGVLSAPALTHDVVYVHTAGGILHALAAADGSSLWKLSVGPPGRLTVLDDEFYVWVSEDRLHAVNLDAPRKLKSVPFLEHPLGSQEEEETLERPAPLFLSGAFLFGVTEEQRLFMRDLES